MATIGYLGTYGLGYGYGYGLYGGSIYNSPYYGYRTIGLGYGYPNRYGYGLGLGYWK
jgi:hypothetical protein